jgi:hypothetical protein
MSEGERASDQANSRATEPVPVTLAEGTESGRSVVDPRSDTGIQPHVPASRTGGPRESHTLRLDRRRHNDPAQLHFTRIGTENDYSRLPNQSGPLMTRV